MSSQQSIMGWPEWGRPKSRLVWDYESRQWDILWETQDGYAHVWWPESHIAVALLRDWARELLNARKVRVSPPYFGWPHHIAHLDTGNNTMREIAVGVDYDDCLIAAVFATGEKK